MAKKQSLYHIVRVNVRRLREAKGWTQEYIANRLDIHSVDVSRFERGLVHKDMLLSRMESYAKVLGVTPASLVTAPDVTAISPVAQKKAGPVRKPVRRGSNVGQKAPKKGKTLQRSKSAGVSVRSAMGRRPQASARKRTSPRPTSRR